MIASAIAAVGLVVAWCCLLALVEWGIAAIEDARRERRRQVAVLELSNLLRKEPRP